MDSCGSNTSTRMSRPTRSETSHRDGSLGGPARSSAFYFGGERPVRRVTLRSGHHVTGTRTTVSLRSNESGFVWKRLDELDPGDFVATSSAPTCGRPPARLRLVPSPPLRIAEECHSAWEMTEELAFLLGAYAAEGCSVRAIGRTVSPIGCCCSRTSRRARGRRVRPGAKVVDDGVRCPDVVVASKAV